MLTFDCGPLLAWLERARADFQAEAALAVKQTADFAASVAKGTTKFNDRSGKLRQSIVVGSSGRYEAFIRAGGRRATYALFVEDGTAPHTIQPKEAGGVLRFVVNGQVMFRKSVHHPGTAPRLFMADAAEQGAEAMGHFMEAGAARAFSH